MKFDLFVVLLAVMILVGCGEPTINSSSKKSLISSTDKIRKTLSYEQEIQFNDSLEFIVRLSFNELGTAKELEEKLNAKIHGQTAQQIISEATRLKLDIEREEAARRLKKISELEEKKRLHTQAREQIDNFKVLKARRYKSRVKNTATLKRAMAELTVKNETPSAISWVRFSGIVTSPGRSVPWFKNKFIDYSIPGGIEPGETAVWQIPLAYGVIEAPSDAILTIKINKLKNAEGKILYSKPIFTERDENRLSELLEQNQT